MSVIAFRSSEVKQLEVVEVYEVWLPLCRLLPWTLISSRELIDGLRVDLSAPTKYIIFIHYIKANTPMQVADRYNLISYKRSFLFGHFEK